MIVSDILCNKCSNKIGYQIIASEENIAGYWAIDRLCFQEKKQNTLQDIVKKYYKAYKGLDKIAQDCIKLERVLLEIKRIKRGLRKNK